MANENIGANPDFIARITYFSIEQGGRRTPAVTGSRPQTRFEGRNEITPAEQVFADKDHILPGESAEAAVTIIIKDRFLKSLYAGQTFEFLEGDRIIGTGTILKLLNRELEG